MKDKIYNTFCYIVNFFLFLSILLKVFRAILNTLFKNYYILNYTFFNLVILSISIFISIYVLRKVYTPINYFHFHE
ncbi:hypothetical protein CBCST_22855 (plasmid) [Clostridium botulinum C str. Stockholm]|nr:hypothetical protein CBCST_22855 [Clostridium botulinum C str. Stockholm]